MSRKNNNPKVPSCQPGWAVYLRTSNPYVQASEQLREMQRQSIDPVIEHSNMPVIEEYIDVQSGTTLNRVNFQRMLEDAARGKFSHLIVAYPDRLGRNIDQALTTLDHLHELGVTVRISTIPKVDDIASQHGHMVLTVMFAIAEYESAMIGERIKASLNEQVKKGNWPWAAPDGYQKASCNRPINATMEKASFDLATHSIIQDSKQAEVWRYAWQLLLNGLSLAEICENLDARGYKLRSGKPFTEISSDGRRRHNRIALSRAFHNPCYAGIMYVRDENGDYRTYKGNWEPIISPEDFSLGVQLLIKPGMERKKIQATARNSRHPTEQQTDN